MDWIIFTADQRAAVVEANRDTDCKIQPRLIDNPAHPRAGSHAAPARVAEGEYMAFWADRLAGFERVATNPADLFLPPEE